MYSQLYYYTVLEIIALFIKTIHVNIKDNDNADTLTVSHLLLSNSSMLLYTLFYFIINGLVLYVLCSFSLDFFAWMFVGLVIIVLCIRIFFLVALLISKVIEVPVTPVNNTTKPKNASITLNSDVTMDTELIPTTEEILSLYT
jgi:hypothetical protein